MRRFLTVLALLCCACVDDYSSTDNAANTVPVWRLPLDRPDSALLGAFQPGFAKTVTLDDSAFAIAAHPNDPLCVVLIPQAAVTCRRIVGGGPGEVESIEQLVASPVGELAVWDRNSMRIGKWNRSLTRGVSIPVMESAAVGIDLLGIRADSTALVARGLTFREMPLGTFAHRERLEQWKGGKLVSKPVLELLGGWLSVVPLGGGRGGLSIAGWPESYVAVTMKGSWLINARNCSVLALDESSASLAPLLSTCTGAHGFRNDVLKQLADLQGIGSEEHRAFSATSEIPERYVGIIGMLSDYVTGELALRLNTRAPADTSVWIFVSAGRAPHAAIRIPRSLRLIGFSQSYLVFVRRDTDDVAAPDAVYWMSRQSLRRDGDTTLANVARERGTQIVGDGTRK